MATSHSLFDRKEHKSTTNQEKKQDLHPIIQAYEDYFAKESIKDFVIRFLTSEDPNILTHFYIRFENIYESERKEVGEWFIANYSTDPKTYRNPKEKILLSVLLNHKIILIEELTPNQVLEDTSEHKSPLLFYHQTVSIYWQSTPGNRLEPAVAKLKSIENQLLHAQYAIASLTKGYDPIGSFQTCLKLADEFLHPNSACFVAECYLEGTGTEVNYQEAHRYFEIAAKNGMSEGLNGLAKLYSNGNSVVPQDVNLAKQLVETAIKRKTLVKFASLHLLGNIYLKLNEDENAAKYFCLSMQKNPKNYVALYELTSLSCKSLSSPPIAFHAGIIIENSVARMRFNQLMREHTDIFNDLVQQKGGIDTVCSLIDLYPKDHEDLAVTFHALTCLITHPLILLVLYCLHPNQKNIDKVLTEEKAAEVALRKLKTKMSASKVPSLFWKKSTKKALSKLADAEAGICSYKSAKFL